jgi:subtilisin family serine protease
MFRKFVRKLLSLILTILLIASVGSAYGSFSVANSNNGGNENYYREISQLISSTWDDSFFGMATMSIGSDTLEVDNHIIELDNPAEIVDGELVLPLDVLQEIGIQVSSDTKGASMKRNGKSIEVTYGDRNMRVNGNRKGMSASAALRNGKPVVPASVLSEEGLDFNIDFDNTTGKIVISNEYQMARVITKMQPGKTLPKGINASKTIVGPDGLYVCQFAYEDQAKAACKYLNGLPDVLYAEPDVIVTLNSDDLYVGPAYSTGLYSHLGWGPGRIDSDSYLDYLIAGGKQNNEVIVGVLDTGLDTSHPFFANRHVSGYNFTNGDVADVNDIRGHGTHVSGTILDVAIALPNVKIMPVKVLGDNGKGASLGVAEGIRCAVEGKAKVINMSLGEMIFGGQGCLELMHENLALAASESVTVVVAAGNNSIDAANCCPAHVESVITVSAFDSSDKPSYFSNFGSCVDVAAPGVDVLSTVPGGRIGRMSGTSMASPHVAGAVALLYCDNPSMTPATAKAVIRSSVDPIPLYNGRYYGSGILNIGKAVGATSFIGITPAYSDLLSNTTQQLTVEYYNNGTIADVTSRSTFLTSNADVAAVDAEGLVTAISSGTATITAAMDGKTAMCTVSVTDNNTDFNNAKTITINTPISVSVTAPGQIRYYQFIPAVSGRHIIESANPVDSTDPYGYLFNADRVLIEQNDNGAGNKNFRISCNFTAGEIYYIGAACNGTGTGSYTFSIAPPILPTSITVSPTEALLNVSETLRLASAILPFYTTDSTVKWTSSDTSVATVSSAGFVTAIAAGNTTILAETANGLKASCAVFVKESNIDIVDATTVIANTTISVSITAARQIRYYKFVPTVDGFHIIESANPAGSTDPYVYLYNESNVQIESDDDSAGNYNFRISSNFTAGQTYYIGAACYNNEIGSYTFSIAQPELPTSIIVTPTEMIVDINETGLMQLTATLLPYNTTDSTVIWTSSNTNVAVVDTRGFLYPRSIGMTIITGETLNGLKAACAVTVAVTNATFDGAIKVTADVLVPVSVATAKQVRYYEFVPEVSGNYTIESTDSIGDIDPYGYLYNANKALITSDDDGAGNHNFRISFNLIAGQTYYIGAACYSTGIGSYAFSIRHEAPQTQDYETLLSIVNAPYGKGDLAKTHAVQVSSAGIITISLTGAKNDSYTISLQQNGVEFAKSASSRVPSLIYSAAEAGEYEVIVEMTSFINGLYSLVVTGSQESI